MSSVSAMQVDDSGFDFDRMLCRAGTSSMKWELYRGRDVLPFWVADMDFPIAPPIREALAARLEHPMFGYTLVPDGLATLVLAHLQREFDWSIDPDWLVWIPGVVPGLAASCRAFCRDGDEIMVNPPIYHHFYNSHEAHRQTLVQVPLHREPGGRWTWDLAAMQAACTERTRMLMLCSPHNPTGTVFLQRELEALAAFAQAHDLIVISDEIHCDLVIDPAAKHRPTAAAVPSIAKRSVTLMSASKTWNVAGLNCSFAIIPDAAMRKQFRAACQSIMPPVAPLAFVAAEAAYRDGGPWRAALLEYLAGNLALIGAALRDLPAVSLQPLEATYLAWIDVSALDLADAKGTFEQYGIGLSGGEQFGQPGFVRLNFACPRPMLEEGLRRFVAAVEALQAT